MHLPENWIFWLGFLAFVLLMLVLDLGVFNRKAHVIKFKEALLGTAMWVALAGVFAVLIYFFGHAMTGSGRPNHVLALEFVTGYLLEEALSVDNLFVFLLVFKFFNVDSEYQHKVLFWGIIGALVMRAMFIILGVSLISRFQWIAYFFGVLLIYAGWNLLKGTDDAVNPGENVFVKFARKYFRVTPDFHAGRFWVERHGQRWFTPLFLVLIVVETTDVAFAVDSIPAVLAITRDPFIVFTSNVFAILGLRALYFAIAGMLEIFHFLHYGLAGILMFIGFKMLAANFIHIPVLAALGVIVVVLTLSVILSLVFPKKNGAAAPVD